MRIAISGASGTGKTTLANAIAHRYGLPVNPIGSRQVAAIMGFASPYDVDHAGKRVEFQNRLFEMKREWEAAHESFVTDRTYFDNLTYCALHMASELPDSAIDDYTRAMNRYEIVFYFPRGCFQSIGNDSARLKSPVYHEFYERILGSFLFRSFGSDRLCVVVSNSAEDRQVEAFCRLDAQFPNEAKP